MAISFRAHMMSWCLLLQQFNLLLRQLVLWVGGEPGKTAGPILRGAARSRTLQEEPNVC